MRILFVFPNISDPGYKLVGISTLSALAKRAGHETSLFDTSFMDLEELSKLKSSRGAEKTSNSIGEKILNFKPISDQSVFTKHKTELKRELVSRLESFKPDVVGISCLSTEWYLSQLILDITKEYDPSIFTIVGGRHCIADPEGAIEHPTVDAICVGEGELAFMRLLEALEKGERDYSIPGLRIKGPDGKVHQTPPKGYLLELDDLPYLDNEIYEEGQFFRPFYGKLWRSLDFNLMRGCNEFCNYCQMAKVYSIYGDDRTIRRYSIDRAIEEFVWQKKRWDLEFLRFHDESFLIVSNQYLKEFSVKYAKDVGLPFVVDISPLTVNAEKAKCLKDMGCVSASMGFETGNEAFRIDQNKAVSSKQALQSFHALADVKIRTVSFNMLGFPGETRDLIFDTIDFMRAARVHSPSINFVYPFKGTALRDQVIRENLFDPATEEYGAAQWCRDYPAIHNPNISSEEYAGIFRTFIFYCKMPKRYWGDLKIAEQLNDKGDAMLGKLSEIYLNEYMDISCAEDEKGRYIPGVALDEQGRFSPDVTSDAIFPHST